LLAEARHAADSLPASARGELDRIAAGANSSGVLLVRGIDVTACPATPGSALGRFREPIRNFEWQLLQLASALGEPFAYPQERQGQLFQDVLPVPGREESLSSESSSVPLTLHTEVPFHPYPPDHLLLLCVRRAPDGGGQWWSSSLAEASRRLDPTHVERLRRGAFTTGLDEAFGGRSHTVPVQPVSADRYRYDLELMTAEGAEERDALSALDEALKRCLRRITPRPGDVLIVDNRLAAHGRAAFRAYFDGTDRWVIRLLTRRDLPSPGSDASIGIGHIDTQFPSVVQSERSPAGAAK
jgi:L-asparagine oxygenase